MTVKIEGRHAAEFLVSEANGTRSRGTLTLKAGQNLPAGAVLELDGTGDAIAFAGDSDSVAAGILWEATDASATGTNADTPVAAVIRDAEVNIDEISVENDDTAGTIKDAAVTSLALIGIIAR